MNSSIQDYSESASLAQSSGQQYPPRFKYLAGSKNGNCAKAAVFQLFWFWTGVAQQACRGRLSKDNRRQGVPGAADQCNNLGAPWQSLNFLPEPQGHRSLRPGTGTL